MKRHPLLRPTALLMLLACAAGMPVLAQTWLQSTVVVDAKHSLVGVANPFSDGNYIEQEGSAPFGRIRALADSDGQSQAYHGLGIAWSQVAPGGVHVHARAQSVASGAHLLRVTGNARASGFVSDFFSLSVPGAASGASFSVTALVRVDGEAFAATLPGWTAFYQPFGDLGSISFWESWVRVKHGGSGLSLAESRAREDCVARTNTGSGPYCVSDGHTGMRALTFSMVNDGPAVELDMRGWASAGTSVFEPRLSVSADSGADMGHSIAWSGITELRDASGHRVTDFTAFSATSGFDYRNAYVSAVPEVSSSLLPLAGLAGVVRRRI